MKIPYYQVAAFATRIFTGNPAAVCILEDWLDDDILQALAAENNQPITSFIVKRNHEYHLRWFSPYKEVEFCGHGTLAAGFVLMNYADFPMEQVVFHTSCGRAMVSHIKKNEFSMDLPTLEYSKIEASQELVEALGIMPDEVYVSNGRCVALYENEKQIRDMELNYNKVTKLPHEIYIVTAKGQHVDFVSRCFNIDDRVIEDAVTGSSHCVLTSLWSEKLGKTKLTAKQLSERSGEIACELQGERTILTSRVVPYLQGYIELLK